MFRIICIAAAVVVLGLPVWANKCKGLKVGAFSTIIAPVCDVAPVAVGTFADLTLSVGAAVQTHLAAGDFTDLNPVYAVRFLNGVSVNSSIGVNTIADKIISGSVVVNESNSGESEPTAFTATASAAIAWGTFTDDLQEGGMASTYSHSARDIGKLAVYFLHSNATGKDFSPDTASGPAGRGWELIEDRTNTDHQMGVVAKVLDGDDDLLINDTFTSVAHVLIPNGTMDIFTGYKSLNNNVPNPVYVLDATGPANYLSVVYVASKAAWVPSANPTDYTNNVSNNLNSAPNKINLVSKRVTRVSFEDPPAWGGTAVTGRGGVITLLIKEAAAASTYLRTGPTASHIGGSVTMSESVTWGKTLDNSGMFVVKDGPISITSDAPSSAPEYVTGYTPVTDALGGTIIAPDGTGTLTRHGIMAGNDMVIFSDRTLLRDDSPLGAISTGQGFSSWQRINSMGNYDPAKNISPTKTGSPLSFANNTVIVKGLGVETDPYTYVSPLGFGANNDDNQYKYNKAFVPIVHLTEEPREGLLMPPLIGWDGVSLYSIEPEPAGPPASAYTWHHADLSVFDPANLPLKDNGNYISVKDDLNSFIGAMNTWFMAGQKQQGHTGAYTQHFYYQNQGQDATNELKYLLGPDTLANKKSVIAAWAAYGLQGLAACEWFRDNDDDVTGDYYTAKGHTMGLIPAILMLTKIFPGDTALMARITAYMDAAEQSVIHAGMETGNRHYVDAEALHSDDWFEPVKHLLRGRHTAADIGLPEWYFLTNGYLSGPNASPRSGHSWHERYREQDAQGTNTLLTLVYQFGGFDAFTTRPAMQAYLDRVYHLRTDGAADSDLTTFHITPVTSAFTVGQTITVAGGGSGTITAIDELAGSTLVWSEDFSGDTPYPAAISDTGGGAGTLKSPRAGQYSGGVGGLGTRAGFSQIATPDTTSVYATTIGADVGYTPWTGNPERQPPPRLSLSGASIVITPSTFRGLNGNNFVRVDYRWQLMSEDYLDEGVTGSEETGGPSANNGAWNVQLDGGDTSFTTPLLAPGNYRVSVRVVNDSAYLGGVGSWSTNWFIKDTSGEDHANDGMATITVR